MWRRREWGIQIYFIYLSDLVKERKIWAEDRIFVALKFMKGLPSLSLFTRTKSSDFNSSSKSLSLLILSFLVIVFFRCFVETRSDDADSYRTLSLQQKLRNCEMRWESGCREGVCVFCAWYVCVYAVSLITETDHLMHHQHEMITICIFFFFSFLFCSSLTPLSSSLSLWKSWACFLRL